jgi:hypothetical protein
MASRAAMTADRLSRQWGWRGWLAILGVPLLIAGLARRRRQRAPAVAPVRAGPEPTRLGRLEREFLAVLASHVSDPFARDGDGLAQALRAAGVDGAVADHVKRLRDRLRAARYGPRGLGDAAELSAEIEQVLRVLGAEGAGAVRRPHAVVATLLLIMISFKVAVAQTPSAEALFEAGALRAAADSFAARVAREPDDPAHWYNLGATLYRAGADGKATAAWTHAARLDPRNATIRRARQLLPPPDAVTEQLLAVGWATPVEWAIIGAAGWVVLWLVVAVRGAARRRLIVVLCATIATAAWVLGAAEWLRRERPVAVIIAESVPVRAAPYGGANATTTLSAGAALLVERVYGPWREVRRTDGVHGWVLEQEIASL